MPSLSEVFAAVVLPALVALTVLLAAWRPWRAHRGVGDQPAPGAWGPPLALGAGWVGAQLALSGWPHVPPAWHLVAYAAGAAAVIGLLAGPPSLPKWTRWLTGAALAIVARGLVRPVGEVDSPLAWQYGLAAGVFVLWTLLEPLHRRERRLWAPLQLAIVLSAISLLLLKSPHLQLSMLSGGLAASCGVATVLAWWRGQGSLAPGGTAVICILLPLILLYAWFYREARPPVPMASFALLAGAPLAAWIGLAPPLARLRAWQRGVLSSAAVALPCATALWLAWPLTE